MAWAKALSNVDWMPSTVRLHATLDPEVHYVIPRVDSLLFMTRKWVQVMIKLYAKCGDAVIMTSHIISTWQWTEVCVFSFTVHWRGCRSCWDWLERHSCSLCKDALAQGTSKHAGTQHEVGNTSQCECADCTSKLLHMRSYSLLLKVLRLSMWCACNKSYCLTLHQLSATSLC